MRPRLGWCLLLGLGLVLSALPAGAAGNFTLGCGLERSASVPTGTMHVFGASLAAVAPGNDSVLVTLETHMPASWYYQFCQVSTGICYVDQARIRLVVGVHDSLTIDIFPSATPGIGGVELTVRSIADPSQVEKCSYALYAGTPVPNVGYSLDCSDDTRWLSSGTTVTFNTPIRNTGAVSDSLWITLHPYI